MLDEKKSISVRLDADAQAALKQLSESSGISVTKLLTLAVFNYCEHVDKAGKINVPLAGKAKK